MILKGQGRVPDIFGAKYLENAWRYILGFNGAPIGNPIWGIESPRDRRHNVCCDRNIFRVQYLANGSRYRFSCDGTPIANGMGSKWSLKNYARRRHVTLRVLNNYAVFDHKWSWYSSLKKCKFISLYLCLHSCEL